MATAIAVWSAIIEPGKKTTFTAQADIRVTNATLDATIADESRTSVKFTYETPQNIDDDDDEAVPEKTSTILCSLTPGKIEQATLDLILGEDDEIELEVIGKNAVHLSGNYIEQKNDFPTDEDSELDDEDDFDLRDVSSDVEIDPAELDIPSDDDDDEEGDSSRFEEITSEKPASKKRSRESDAMEVEPSAQGEGSGKLSKKEKKNKKQKAENGSAILSGETSVTENEAKGKDKKDKKEKTEEKSKESTQTPKDMKELPGGLQIKDVKTGTGKAAKKGDLISMRYIGKFTNGKIFDQNTKGKPFQFKIGAGQVIKGFDEGLVGLQVGGERLLIVPPKLGYGNRKIDGIPAGSTLRFECKLLEIK